jgi:hypothetical protein
MTARMLRLLPLAMLLALPLVAAARLPVLVDFTEKHTVETVTLAAPEVHALFSQLKGEKRIGSEMCKGENDPVRAFSLQQAVRADLLGDGAGHQVLVVILVQSCEQHQRPTDARTTLALFRGGKLHASAEDLQGAAVVELVTRPTGASRDVVVLRFPWFNRGIAGDGAEIWAAGPRGLQRLMQLGPVRFNACGVEYGAEAQAAVLLVKRAEPLELLQKVYQATCPLPEGRKPTWNFVKDGALEP